VAASGVGRRSDGVPTMPRYIHCEEEGRGCSSGRGWGGGGGCGCANKKLGNGERAREELNSGVVYEWTRGRSYDVGWRALSR
jgi:hypothetical protein